MEGVSILPATVSHTPAIVNLLLELAEVLDDMQGIALDRLTVTTQHLLDDPHTHILLAEAGDQIAGLISFSTRRTLMHAEPSGLIDELIVSGKHRQKGIGRRLVAEAVAYCRRLGCTEVEVSTEKTNHKARAFYRHCGFEEGAVLLERHLSPGDTAAG